VTLAKSIYNLGRVYALLKKQDKLTGEQASLLEELKSFRAKIVEIDGQLHGMFELGYEMGKRGKA
jgi:hypothetical protein